MKNEITINPNHPAYLHCEMVLTMLQQKVSAIQTEEQVREIARKELKATNFHTAESSASSS